LGEQQEEQAGDSGVEADGVVVYEQFDLGPALFVGEGDGGLAGGAGGDVQSGGDGGGVARPAEERGQRLRWAAVCLAVAVQVVLGGRGDVVSAPGLPVHEPSGGHDGAAGGVDGAVGQGAVLFLDA
jgi:hypothetical protein